MDRNSEQFENGGGGLKSPPARVAWIETVIISGIYCIATVATREGGVDRNAVVPVMPISVCTVATREGGVDRNRQGYGIC